MNTMESVSETEFHIRQALPDEATKLTDLAYASKRSWGYPEEELDCCCGPLTVTPDYIRDNAVFVAVSDRGIHGFFSLIPTDRPGVIELDHFWVSPETMGRGIGRAMFGRVRDEAIRLGMRTLFIVSDPNAEAFYLRMKAIRTGDVPACSGEGRLPTLELPLAPQEASTPSGE